MKDIIDAIFDPNSSYSSMLWGIVIGTIVMIGFFLIGKVSK